MFDLCRGEILDVLRAQSLRAIATLCCVSKSILELEEVSLHYIPNVLLSEPSKILARGFRSLIAYLN